MRLLPQSRFINNFNVKNSLYTAALFLNLYFISTRFMCGTLRLARHISARISTVAIRVGPLPLLRRASLCDESNISFICQMFNWDLYRD